MELLWTYWCGNHYLKENIALHVTKQKNAKNHRYTVFCSKATRTWVCFSRLHPKQVIQHIFSFPPQTYNFQFIQTPYSSIGLNSMHALKRNRNFFIYKFTFPLTRGRKTQLRRKWLQKSTRKQKGTQKRPEIEAPPDHKNPNSSPFSVNYYSSATQFQP